MCEHTLCRLLVTGGLASWSWIWCELGAVPGEWCAQGHFSKVAGSRVGAVWGQSMGSIVPEGALVG